MLWSAYGPARAKKPSTVNFTPELLSDVEDGSGSGLWKTRGTNVTAVKIRVILAFTKS